MQTAHVVLNKVSAQFSQNCADTLISLCQFVVYFYQVYVTIVF
jgi:hypothetical protein